MQHRGRSRDRRVRLCAEGFPSKASLLVIVWPLCLRCCFPLQHSMLFFLLMIFWGTFCRLEARAETPQAMEMCSSFSVPVPRADNKAEATATSGRSADMALSPDAKRSNDDITSSQVSLLLLLLPSPQWLLLLFLLLLPLLVLVVASFTDEAPSSP